MFFDAEGTLYVPKGRAKAWEFWSDPSPELAVEFFRLDHGVRESLEHLRRQAETMCVVSWNRGDILDELLEQNGIRDMFDEVMLNEDKGKLIGSFLSRRGLPRESALMVGDTPEMDIYPVERAGIEAVLVDRPYNRDAVAERIGGLRELPAWLSRAGSSDLTAPRSGGDSTLDQFVDLGGTPHTKRLMAVTDR